MKTWLVLVLAACGGTATSPPSQTISGSAPNHTPSSPAPAVANAAVLAVEDATTTPPVVVMIDAGGKQSLAAAASWADLAAGKYTAGPKPSDPTEAMMHIKESLSVGKPPTMIVDSFVAGVESHYDLPPPFEYYFEEPEDNGTGTSMALDDPKRAKLPRTPRRGVVGPPLDTKYRWPKQESIIVGEIGAPLDPQPAVIVAAPTARASSVVAAINDTEGMIAVVHQGTMRRLRLQFVRLAKARRADAPRAWVEVQFTVDGFELEAVPGVPLAAKLDTEFAAKLAAAQKRRQHATEGPVDVLVAPDTTAQQLVDVLVALDVAGVKTIGLGLAPKPGSEAAEMRGHRMPAVSLGRLTRHGDIDERIIGEHVRAQRAAFIACYTQRLAKSPDLEGTVQAQFFIAAAGTVVVANASGFDSDVANCVAAAIKKIVFKGPIGVDGVQVNYPMTFLQ